jgi:MFS family permease
MSLFLDIGTGTGLASATGVRPYLPPLLAGGLARGDTGIDFDGTDFRFLESTGFLAAVVVLGVAAFLVERSAARRASGDRRRTARDPFDVLAGVIGLALGALLFAGALADNGHDAWIGLLLGPLCAALGWVAIGGLVQRVRTRLEADQAALLTAYADLTALVLAAIAVFLPPVAFLAIPAFVVLILGGRRREGQKYAGLRILR